MNPNQLLEDVRNILESPASNGEKAQQIDALCELYKDACVKDVSPAPGYDATETPAIAINGSFSETDFETMSKVFLDAHDKIASEIVLPRGLFPTLKPLKWDTYSPVGNEERAACKNANIDYRVLQTPVGGLYFSQVRPHASWVHIGQDYETPEEAKDSCERHRNQRLRDQLQ